MMPDDPIEIICMAIVAKSMMPVDPIYIICMAIIVTVMIQDNIHLYHLYGYNRHSNAII